MSLASAHGHSLAAVAVCAKVSGKLILWPTSRIVKACTDVTANGQRRHLIGQGRKQLKQWKDLLGQEI